MFTAAFKRWFFLFPIKSEGDRHVFKNLFSSLQSFLLCWSSAALICLVMRLPDHPCILPKCWKALLFLPKPRLLFPFCGALDLYLSVLHLHLLPHLQIFSFLFLFAPVSDSLSLNCTGCSLCLPYLLTQYHWFGIELFGWRMLLHSSVPTMMGGGSGCVLALHCSSWMVFLWIVVKVISGTHQSCNWLTWHSICDLYIVYFLYSQYSLGPSVRMMLFLWRCKILFHVNACLCCHIGHF